MNSNGVPGCVVTDKLVAEISGEAKSEDKGKSARLTRAAKQVALAKGLGCFGAHIGGHGLSYRMMEQIISESEEYYPKWESLVGEFDYPQNGGFYYFEKDEKTGLNIATTRTRKEKKSVPLIYRISRLAHKLVFNENVFYFRMLQAIAAWIDGSPLVRRIFGFFEHLAKTALFGCKNCGDCGLFDVAYICPMAHCPKEQRNGPCGGSSEGWCEVYPKEKRCIWVRAYHRLKAFGEESKIEEYTVPSCNWDLRESPSWLNFYLGRDHTAKRLGIKHKVSA